VATVEIGGSDAVLKLGRMEAVEAVHMHAISAPLTAIQSVEGVDNPWPVLRGVKEVGTEIPGKNMIGTRTGEGFKDFCAVHRWARRHRDPRSRGEPVRPLGVLGRYQRRAARPAAVGS